MQDTQYQQAKDMLFEMYYFAVIGTGITREQFRERFEATVTAEEIQRSLDILQESQLSANQISNLRSKIANRRLGAEAVQSGDDSKVLFSLDDI